MNSPDSIKVLYDYQAFAMQCFGGISRYFTALINHLNNPVEGRVTPFWGNNFHVMTQLPGIQFNTHLPDRFNSTTFIQNINKCNANKQLNKPDWQIFHPTFYDPYFLKKIDKRPYVITIHDLAHEYFPGSFPIYDQTVKWKKNLAAGAAHIITVSQNSKENIMRLLHIPEHKITVIHHGYSRLTDQKPKLDWIVLKKNFLLFVGKRNSYKNFNEFLKAVAPILRETNIEVICSGGGKFTKDELLLSGKLLISDKVHYLHADDSELAFLYANALALVFPSKYEGFGMPVLEAFAHSCPVVAADNSALPEVAASAAIYFNPYEIDDIRHKCRKIIDDSQLRQRLIDEGKQRLKHFSWHDTARKTENVYTNLL